MYECAVSFQVQVNRFAEAMCVLRHKVAPVLKEQRGLLGLCLLPDEERSAVTVLSIWASRGHALAAEAAPGLQAPMKRLDGLAVPADASVAAAEW